MADETHTSRERILAAIEEHWRYYTEHAAAPDVIKADLAERIDRALFGSPDSAHPTPWRQGWNVPENLYDADQALHGNRPGRPVGVMRTPELGKRVVEAVNGIDEATRTALADLEAEVRRLPLRRLRDQDGNELGLVAEINETAVLDLHDYPRIAACCAPAPDGGEGQEVARAVDRPSQRFTNWSRRTCPRSLTACTSASTLCSTGTSAISACRMR